MLCVYIDYVNKTQVLLIVNQFDYILYKLNKGNTEIAFFFSFIIYISTVLDSVFVLLVTLDL